MDEVLLRDLRESLRILKSYQNQTSGMRQYIKNEYTYNPYGIYQPTGKPFIYHLQLLAHYSDKFRKVYRKKFFLDKNKKEDPYHINELVNEYAKNRREVTKIDSYVNDQTPRPSAPKPVILPPQRDIVDTASRQIQGAVTGTANIVRSRISNSAALAEKIKHFEKELNDPVMALRLVAQGHFTDKELEVINKLGLAKIGNFKDEKIWQQQVYQATLEITKTQKIIKKIPSELIKARAMKESEIQIPPPTQPQLPTIKTPITTPNETADHLEQIAAQNPPKSRIPILEEYEPTLDKYTIPTTPRVEASPTPSIPSIRTTPMPRFSTPARLPRVGFRGPGLLTNPLSLPMKLNPMRITATVVGVFVAMFLFMIINQSNSLFPPFDQKSAIASSLPGGGTTVSSDISSCKFIRRGDGPNTEKSYQSPLLISYMQEASNLTSIPLPVLAAFIRVESPQTVSFTDDQVRNYPLTCPSRTNGTQSPTGALGIMQLQPQGTIGNDAPAIANGSKLLGIEYNALTAADYCDVRKNIIMGAGFILKKLSYRGFGDGTKWDPSWTTNKTAIHSLVDGYYGCLFYGGPNPLKCEGPYNYGDDVFDSVQNCKVQPTSSYTPSGSGLISCPVNKGSVTTGSKDIPGGHCSVEYQRRFPCIPPGASGYTGRDTAIDIQSPDKIVFLPNINGEPVEWIIDEAGTTINDHEGGGIAVSATAGLRTQSYRIRFVHIQSTALRVGQKALSGTEVGEYNLNANHVHVTLQENGIFKPADLYFNLCK